MSDDPYLILGVDESADDEAIKKRYHTLVRSYPPDREPERFKLYRKAYEALIDDYARLEQSLLHTNGSAMARLKSHCLEGAEPAKSRASKATIAALLAEGLGRI